MRAHVTIGARRFEIRDLADLAPAREGVLFPSFEDAVSWLRWAARESGNLASLRRLAAESNVGQTTRLLSDEEVIRALARDLVHQRRRLVERPVLEPHGSSAAAPSRPPPPAPPAAPEDARRPAEELTWVTIQLVGEDDKPIPGERYRVDLPDGSTREGRLDGEGLARIRGIAPGQCQVTFPNLDEEAWVPIGKTGVP